MEHTQRTATSALRPPRGVRITTFYGRAWRGDARGAMRPGTWLPLLLCSAPSTRHPPIQPRAPSRACLLHPRPTDSQEVAPRQEGPRLFFLWVEEKRNRVSTLCFESKICHESTNLRHTPWCLHPSQDECRNPSSVTSTGETLSCGF